MAPRPRDRRDTIIRTAAEMFVAESFDAVSLRRIAERVGISGPAIYRHFPDKEALLIEIVERFFVTVADTFDADDIVAANIQLCIDDPLPRILRSTEWDSSLRPLTPVMEDRLTNRVPNMIDGLNRVNARFELTDTPVILYAFGGALDDIAQRVVDGSTTRTFGGPPTTMTPALQQVMADASMRLLRCDTSNLSPRSEPTAPAWTPMKSREDTILDAAIVRFFGEGFHHVTMEQIGADVGVSASGLYRYFGSKHEILAEAIERMLRATKYAMTVALQADSATAALRRIAAALADTAFAEVLVIRIQTRELRALPPELRNGIQRTLNALTRRVRDTLVEARGYRLDAADVLATTGIGLCGGVARICYENALDSGHYRAWTTRRLEAYFGLDERADRA